MAAGISALVRSFVVTGVAPPFGAWVRVERRRDLARVALAWGLAG